MNGRIRAIHVAAEQGAPPEPRSDVQAVADAGLRGDRYFHSEGTFADRDGCALTLITGEAIDAVERDYDIELKPGAHRRNLTTEGIALNHLVGERFQLGEAVCLGIELCEPCSYLERHLETEGVRNALIHRGGLRCRILESGRIRIGDRIEIAERETGTVG